MDISAWLRELGMEKYEPAFRDNAVDGSVLPRLTSDDLKDIGVTKVGDRRRILDAIAVLRQQSSLSTSTGSPPSAVPAPIPSELSTPVEAGERRHVTVMFCDLVDSTSIASRLDAEEWRDLVGGYLEAAAVAVAEMGGIVAKKLGDGLMALFGHPTAHENDAERAARAALAIQSSLAELNRKNAAGRKPELAARIGIDTGQVVIDGMGEIFGDAPNIASRVQALTEAGSVVITARVQHQIAGLFVVDDRGAQQLRGLKEPVSLFRLVRLSGGGRRLSQRTPTPLVGRDDEITMVMRRWERARLGDGQFVLIVGEPGLGKSRLIEEFHTQLRETPHTWVEWVCSQLLQNTPLHPIAEWGHQRFGGADIPPERQFAELENLLAQVTLSPAENASLLAPLLDIPLPRGHEATFESEELRRRQLMALINWVIAGARPQPMVLVLEDLHWADPTTLEVMRGIAERGALAPLFVLATARPEFRPTWGMRSHHGTIPLVPLDRSQVRAMVAELSARSVLPRNVVDGVAARTGGVPLFIEEVTRLLLERGVQEGALEIPPTLQQSLMARLDRLGSAREVAQIGSVIGREFSYCLLREVAEIGDAPLQAALEKLAEADILLVQGLPPDSDYRFRHALIQDAAYENLLKSRRHILHRRVAEIMAESRVDTAAPEPEVLAHHYSEAGLTEAAAEWWAKAGYRSLGRSALVEAAKHFVRALDEIAHLPATSATRRQQIKLQVDLINPLMHVKGHAAPETRSAVKRASLLIEEAETLGEPLEDALLPFSVLYGSWIANFIAFDGDTANKLAARFLALAEQRALTVALMIGHRIMGMALLFTGHLVEACANLDRAISLYDFARHHQLATRFSVDPAATSLFYKAQALWCLGHPKAAAAAVDQGTRDARRSGHAATLMFALLHGSTVHVLCRNHAQASAGLDELVALADESGALYWKAYEMSVRGCLLAENGKAFEAVHTGTAGISALRSTGTTVWVPWYLLNLARAYADAARFDDAWRTIDEAMSVMEHAKETWCESELHRIAGEIALQSSGPDTAKAQAYFECALASARTQQAKSWELRAAMSMARLWRDQGKRSEARALLTPIYGWFTEGLDTLDLKEAKALLGALAS